MIALWLTSTLAGAFQLERVDLISEDPGTFLWYDAPRLRSSPDAVALRFLAQVKPVFGLDLDGHLQLGLSVSSQSLVYDREIVYFPTGTWNLHAGVQTALLLPRGLLAGTSVHLGPFRFGVGMGLVSSATWRRPDWTTWTAVPTLAFGIGRLY